MGINGKIIEIIIVKSEVFYINIKDKQSNQNLSNYKITREFSNKSVKELIINSLKVVK